MNNQQKEAGSGLLGNAIAVIGFIAIAAIILWGIASIIRYAPTIFSALTSPFTNETPRIVIQELPQAPSGAPLTISWEHDGSQGGRYGFAYACRENFRIETSNADGVYQTLPCSTPHVVPRSNTAVHSLRVVPILASGETLTVPIAISYQHENTDQNTEATADLVVVAAEETEEPTVPEPEEEEYPQPTPPSTGTPDLSVRLIATGVLDPYTRLFTPKSPVGTNELAAIRFEVINTGTARAGSWYFTANLPTQTPYHYTSPHQQPLGPGDRIEFTLSFDHTIPGTQTVSIQADAGNNVAEISETNNHANYPMQFIY